MLQAVKNLRVPMQLLLDRLLTFINRKLCVHPTKDMIRKITSQRIYLECTLCGFETPGFYYADKKAA